MLLYTWSHHICFIPVPLSSWETLSFLWSWNPSEFHIRHNPPYLQLGRLHIFVTGLFVYIWAMGEETEEIYIYLVDFFNNLKKNWQNILQYKQKRTMLQKAMPYIALSCVCVCVKFSFFFWRQLPLNDDPWHAVTPGTSPSMMEPDENEPIHISNRIQPGLWSQCLGPPHSPIVRTRTTRKELHPARAFPLAIIAGTHGDMTVGCEGSECTLAVIPC